MATSVSSVWEVGSEFHWSETYLAPSPRPEALPPGILFARARGALAAMMRMLAEGGASARLHLPSYFCIDIAEYLAGLGEVRWYRHLPGRGVDYTTLAAEQGDIVLALNMFGAETGEDWQRWEGREGVYLIEDHSHDPLSSWAKASRADYAIASLRKTLPVPDGALLWSPAGRTLPSPTPGRSEGADLKLAAMILKAAYLRGSAVEKDEFRALQLHGEAMLDEEEGAAAHEFTRSALMAIDLMGLRSARRRNYSLFKELLDRAPIAGVELAFSAPEDCAPFNPVLRFASRPMRDRVRSGLAKRGIFAPNHWPQEHSGFNSGDQQALDLSATLLTIPLDFRCAPEDVQQVVRVLRGVAAAEA